MTKKQLAEQIYQSVQNYDRKKDALEAIEALLGGLEPVNPERFEAWGFHGVTKSTSELGKLDVVRVLQQVEQDVNTVLEKAVQEYLDGLLADIAASNPTAVIHYAYSSQANMHIVDLSGTDVEALSADEWAMSYLSMVDNFEERFPKESLLLVREGDLVRVTPDQAQRIIVPASALENYFDPSA